MKPRGLNSLLSKQVNKTAPSSGASSQPPGMRLGALEGAQEPASEKQDQVQAHREKSAKGSKRSSSAAKNSAAAPRRTAPGG